MQEALVAGVPGGVGVASDKRYKPLTSSAPSPHAPSSHGVRKPPGREAETLLPRRRGEDERMRGREEERKRG
ncbi:hypothetical protein NHX12_034293 [Muraenolepis orangiensis]|uniref:Uncharacterized protein n=1 Tax=Muraenolepis orangiensis TaxID=630683 RepID=A0A9Q0D5L4_9TELE|nr:hypothetical protein NHX12_034293 [Muraenolepis orangiensis]